MQRFQTWRATLAEDRKNGTTPGMWLATAAIVLLVLSFASFVEPGARWFKLPFWPALACFLPAFLLGFGAGFLEQRGRLSLTAYAVIALVDAGLLQFFFAALVAMSAPPGAFAMASLFLLTVAFHGYLLRASVAFPYAPGCTILAILAAAMLAPNPDTNLLFAFVGPTAILVSLLMGSAGLREHEGRRDRERLREAIHFRALAVEVDAHQQMSQRVLDLLRYNHDAGNALSTIFVNAQLLGDLVQRGTESPLPAIDAKLTKLLTELGRLKTLVQQANRIADDLPTIEPASLLEVVRDVTADCQSLFPATKIEVTAPQEIESLTVNVYNGTLGLRRILENILHNACEGDGHLAARTVRIEVQPNDNAVLVRFTDDGPGFRQDQLAQTGPTPFHTTKPAGHGLGLFNVSHLVQASGGAVKLGNGPEQGAMVDLEFVAASP
jgi:two-component system C4-dicarboxylate transport sensor histidine kinase DctB